MVLSLTLMPVLASLVLPKPEGSGAAVVATGTAGRRHPADWRAGRSGLRREPLVRAFGRCAALPGRDVAGGGRGRGRAVPDAPGQAGVHAASEGGHALQVRRDRPDRLRPGHGVRLHRPQPRLRVRAQAIGGGHHRRRGAAGRHRSGSGDSLQHPDGKGCAEGVPRRGGASGAGWAPPRWRPTRWAWS